MTSTEYAFLKGHGTENDFVILPDLDGTIHGDLADDRVRALCDRRAGIGGDGVLRVLRHHGEDADWFMDYRNSDGSIAEMCGNGVRVFARYLIDSGLAQTPLRIATRAGVKVVHGTDELTVDMGSPKVLEPTQVSVDHHFWQATNVDMGNPHAVAFVEHLDEAGSLLAEPIFDRNTYPKGVNIEFVQRLGDRHVAMRVHERGSGETRSCGTGACAVMVASALADGRGPGETYVVDLPGGRLRVEWTMDDRILMSGPAVIVAEGTTSL